MTDVRQKVLDGRFQVAGGIRQFAGGRWQNHQKHHHPFGDQSRDQQGAQRFIRAMHELKLFFGKTENSDRGEGGEGEKEEKGRKRRRGERGEGEEEEDIGDSMY